jgi:hypothetical protein
VCVYIYTTIKVVRGRLPPLVLPSVNLHRPLASVNLHRPPAHAHVRPPPPPASPSPTPREPPPPHLPLQSAALTRIVHLHSIPRISSACSPARRRPFLRDQELAAGVIPFPNPCVASPINVAPSPCPARIFPCRQSPLPHPPVALAATGAPRADIVSVSPNKAPLPSPTPNPKTPQPPTPLCSTSGETACLGTPTPPPQIRCPSSSCGLHPRQAPGVAPPSPAPTLKLLVATAYRALDGHQRLTHEGEDRIRSTMVTGDRLRAMDLYEILLLATRLAHRVTMSSIYRVDRLLIIHNASCHMEWFVWLKV